MENLTQEQLEKAKQAKSAEELLILAKENGMEMTEEEAKAYYAQLNPVSGEIADDELENVAGGGCGQQKYEFPPEGALVTFISHTCPFCGGTQGIFHLERKQWYVSCINGCAHQWGTEILFGGMNEDPKNEIIW